MIFTVTHFSLLLFIHANLTEMLFVVSPWHSFLRSVYPVGVKLSWSSLWIPVTSGVILFRSREFPSFSGVRIAHVFILNNSQRPPAESRFRRLETLLQLEGNFPVFAAIDIFTILFYMYKPQTPLKLESYIIN